MKTNSIGARAGSRLTAGPGVFAAVACGFWVLQFSLWSAAGSVLGAPPRIGSLIFLGFLIIFAGMRMTHWWSTVPVVFGLASTGMLVFLYFYLSCFASPTVPILAVYYLVALSIGVTGALLDVRQYWQLVVKSHRHAMDGPKLFSHLSGGNLDWMHES